MTGNTEESAVGTSSFTHGVAEVFSGAALIVTRSIEWGQVLIGYEQAQKYTIFDEARSGELIIALLAVN